MNHSAGPGATYDTHKGWLHCDFSQEGLRDVKGAWARGGTLGRGRGPIVSFENAVDLGGRGGGGRGGSRVRK
jgi:hypothetical protein